MLIIRMVILFYKLFISMIIIYTKENCPYCELAKELIKSENIEYEERDIYADIQAVRELSSQS